MTAPGRGRFPTQGLARPNKGATREMAEPFADARIARSVHRCAELLCMRLGSHPEKVGIEEFEHRKVSQSLGPHRR